MGSGAEAQAPTHLPDAPQMGGKKISLSPRQRDSGTTGRFRKAQVSEASRILLKGIWFPLTKRSKPCNLKSSFTLSLWARDVVIPLQF